MEDEETKPMNVESKPRVDTWNMAIRRLSRREGQRMVIWGTGEGGGSIHFTPSRPLEALSYFSLWKLSDALRF